MRLHLKTNPIRGKIKLNSKNTLHFILTLVTLAAIHVGPLVLVPWNAAAGPTLSVTQAEAVLVTVNLLLTTTDVVQVVLVLDLGIAVIEAVAVVHVLGILIVVVEARLDVAVIHQNVGVVTRGIETMIGPNKMIARLPGE